MVVVISAGGKGTRVASVNSALPKPMLPICGKPVLQHQVECLRRQGIKRIILTIGHLGEQIRNYFRDGSRFGVQIEYIEETEPLGTAGALYYLKDKLDGDFLYLNGDLIFDVDIGRMVRFHKTHGAEITLLGHPKYHNCVNAGIHVLSSVVLDRLDTLRRMDLDRELIRPAIPGGKVFVYRSPEYVKDMGTPERIQEVKNDLNSGKIRKKNLAERQKAIFLDRDGTINRYVGLLKAPEELELLAGAAEAIRRINQSGYLVILITNQPVIARGEVTWEQLDEIHRKLETLLGQQGAYLDDIFVCPHHPDKGFPGERPEYKIDCDCRKPKPGLILQAAQKYNIELSESWLLGDSMRDVDAGKAAGCKTLQVSEEFGLLEAIQVIGL